MSHYIIVNRRPGLIRGGKAHPAVAAHTLDGFSPEQWADIVGEPAITVVAGSVVTPTDLHGIFARIALAPAEARAAKKAGNA